MKLISISALPDVKDYDDLWFPAAYGDNETVKVPMAGLDKHIKGGGCIRLTRAEYEALPEIEPSTIYAIEDKDGMLTHIYIGDTLIAESDTNGKFTYRFPFRLNINTL